MIKYRLISLLAVFFSTMTQAAPYTIVDLGVLTDGASFGNGLNSNGLVVGQFDGPVDELGFRIFSFHAFSFDGTDFLDLGTLEPTLEDANSSALAVNDNNQIVGFAEANISEDETITVFRERAFILENGVMVDLGLPESISSSESRAISINNLGIISGWAKTLRDPLEPAAAFFEQAAIIDPTASGDKFTLLGSLIADDSDVTAVSSARASNSAGQIAGWSTTEIDGQVSFVHAFYIDPLGTGEMVDMGTLGGSKSSTIDINESGIIVGRSDLEDASVMAFKFDLANDTELVALGTLVGELPGSVANGINDLGQIVGLSVSGPALDPSFPVEPTHAVLFENGMVIDLSEQIDCSLGWVLAVAKDINNAGQIVGSGSLNGETHGFLITPDANGGAAVPCDTTQPPPDGGSSSGGGGSLGWGLLFVILIRVSGRYHLRFR